MHSHRLRRGVCVCVYLLHRLLDVSLLRYAWRGRWVCRHGDRLTRLEHITSGGRILEHHGLGKDARLVVWHFTRSQAQLAELVPQTVLLQRVYTQTHYDEHRLGSLQYLI